MMSQFTADAAANSAWDDTVAISLNDMFENTRADRMLERLLDGRFVRQVAVLSSFGADSAVMLHMISRLRPDVAVIFLDTGRHFAETMDYQAALARRLGLTNVTIAKPDPRRMSVIDPEETLWRANPDICCDERKTLTMEAALTPFRAWISGRKRFQTDARGDMPLFERDAKGRLKINPLADWSLADIARYFEKHDLPRHPLWSQGYRSIGCEPCTERTGVETSDRDGRWRGCAKTECGIHL